MAIICPNCKTRIDIKAAKPGVFTPKCPTCKEPFKLTISADPNQPPGVALLPPPQATVAPQRPAVPAAGSPPTSAETVVAGAAAAATAPSAGIAAATSTHAGVNVPEKLGGYRIVKELGRGGMGSVYLGRQISLDRDVAVKVMRPEWSQNPVFVARFTREAYAAAQLVHHNVVQIYDIDSVGNLNFFGMEFVDGSTLGELVKERGKLDVEEAAGYILQAARGLKFAHDRGMIHRDIKPDNLLLNSEGIVKVADLGLVKTPEADQAEQTRAAQDTKAAPSTKAQAMTGVNVTSAEEAMGTPAYMPPEQSRDAANVDHRADIYSLGCTFYVLVTGRLVHSGTTAAEVMQKHAEAQAIRPDQIVKRVPAAVSDIIMKMIARKPEDRYASMQALSADLEAFLGLDSSDRFSPTEVHAQTLDLAIDQFNRSSSAVLRSRLGVGFLGLCAILALLSAFTLQGSAFASMLGLGLLSFLSYFVISGITGRTYLFGKVRQFVLGSSPGEWLMGVVGALMIVAVLTALNLHWLWLGILVASAVLSAGFHMTLDRRVASERSLPITQMQQVLKPMRLRGLDEQTLQRFVCRHAGQRWEGLFEALFGYEAKIAARRRWGQDSRGQSRPKSGAWRDVVVRWIDERQTARKQKREMKHLAAIERKALAAKGLSDAEADRRAQRTAETMVDKAAELRTLVVVQPPPASTVATVAGATAGAPTASSKPAGPTLEQLLADEDDPRARRAAARRRGARSGGPLDLLLGARVRFIVGGLLIAGCAMWLRQNGLVEERPDLQELRGLSALVGAPSPDTQPLQLPLVPLSVTQHFNSVNPGIAGLILVFSALFFTGARIAVFIIPAAAIVMFGHRLGLGQVWIIPEIWTSIAAAGVLVVLGLLFSRSRY